MSGGSGSLVSVHGASGRHRVTPLELSYSVAAAAASKKARDVVIMDVRELVSYTDFMVVCTGQTARQVAAIADEIRARIKADHGVIPHHVDGEQEAEWVLIDLLDVVVHVFTPEARAFYRLDRLWRDAPREEIAAAAS